MDNAEGNVTIPFFKIVNLMTKSSNTCVGMTLFLFLPLDTSTTSCTLNLNRLRVPLGTYDREWRG